MEMPEAIVDAHHHLWDLGVVRYPWLTDGVDPDFLLGDYAGLRRDYAVADYHADAAGLPVVATVHCEAEADRSDRCLFAGNFPVSRLRVGYRDWVAAVSEALSGCSADERAAVFAGNARRVYRLVDR